MNHLRRIISLLLVLVLCFGLISCVSAAEADTPGADTQTNLTEAEETVPTAPRIPSPRKNRPRKQNRSRKNPMRPPMCR